MSTYKLSDFETEVGYRIKLPSGTTILDSTTIQSFIQKSAANIYSKHRAFTKTNDFVGNGTYTYTINTTNFPGWIRGFSEIKEIEYPADECQNREDALIPFEDWEVIEKSGVEYLRFSKETPSASYTIRVTYSIPHAIAAAAADTTIYDNDFPAVCDLAASISAQAISTYYGHSINSTIGADAVDYRNKSDVWSSRAKELLKSYIDHMFPEVSASMARREWDTVYLDMDSTISRLTHLNHRR